MLRFNIHEAKTNFSKVVSRVAAGEEVLIAKNGRPVAKVVPLTARRAAKRPFGTAKNLVKLSTDWDKALPGDILRAFES